MRGLLIVPTQASRPRTEAGFDPDRGWRLHPQVSVRPEPFGALLYHFGTRRLSFLKNDVIVAVVKSLDDHPDARSACRAAGVDSTSESGYFSALTVLAESNILIPNDATETEEPA